VASLHRCQLGVGPGIQRSHGALFGDLLGVFVATDYQRADTRRVAIRPRGLYRDFLSSDRDRG
jgi:hypothetical protein